MKERHIMQIESFGPDRRSLIIAGGTAFAALASPDLLQAAAGNETGKEKEVSATEDMMREHGVLRRALLVYAETAPRLRTSPGTIDPKALNETAMLFRKFGEDYHERMLEEAHVFPVVRKAGGPGSALTDILVAQHNRGREITDYILNVTGKGKIGVGDAEPMTRVLESFVLMYQNHAAREDTVVFPAWKDILSERQLEEMGDLFENIEHQQFGKDGFDDAVAKIAAIERALGYAELTQFTAPPPPHP
jgi:hemerythrin-like domain-containing protein